MFEFATRDDLKKIANQINLNEQVSIRKSAETEALDGATFLSHSTKDMELVAGAIRLLQAYGAVVYIDKKDSSLPPYTNKQTAKNLKSRISQCKKFVLLASHNSNESKWVPWELGIADGYKGLQNTAILPAVEDQNNTSWTSWEYLGLYDRIVWGDLRGHPKKVWMVLDERNNVAFTLKEWLRR
jgi:hypothetical protein